MSTVSNAQTAFNAAVKAAVIQNASTSNNVDLKYYYASYDMKQTLKFGFLLDYIRTYIVSSRGVVQLGGLVPITLVPVL